MNTVSTPAGSKSSSSSIQARVRDIREAGRNTQGVKLINLDENDRLQAIAPVISEGEEDRQTEMPVGV